MPKAISNIDTAFLEDTTARAISIIDLCQLLADLIDTPDELAILQEIRDKAEGQRQHVIRQREYMRSNYESV
jgi:hypothetical protein